MTKARDLINDALIQAGVQDPSESMEASKAAFGLRELNRMLGSWANEDLMIPTKDRLTFNLVNGQQSYTLGIGGAFNTTYPVRPGQIDLVSVIVNGVELPVEVLNDEQWRDITVKAVSSTFPLQMWANGNYPLNTLYFWPIPTGPNQLVMSLWGRITAFANLGVDAALPEGYEDAIIPNLALRLGPAYGTQPNPVLNQIAQSAKGRIKAMNWEPSYRSVDSALTSGKTNIGQKSRGYVVD